MAVMLLTYCLDILSSRAHSCVAAYGAIGGQIMKATLEYILTTLVVMGAAYLIVSPLVNMVAQSMDDSANMIAEAGRH